MNLRDWWKGIGVTGRFLMWVMFGTLIFGLLSLALIQVLRP